MRSLLIRFILSLLCIESFGQIPPQDQCQYVNQTEPPQCPETVGPPCPPCLVNTAPDYTTGDAVIISSSTRTKIESYMNNYTNYWLTEYPPSKVIPAGSPSNIISGSAGRSLMFLRMYNYTRNVSYLNISSEYMDNAIRSLDIPHGAYTSYLGGDIGVYMVAAQIAKFKNNAQDLDRYLNQISDIFSDVDNAIKTNASISPKYGYDMFDAETCSGLSGLLYAQILVSQYFGTSSIAHLNEYITNLSHYLIEIGLQRGKQYNVSYLVYQMPWTHDPSDKCYLSGGCDGVGGVIKMLLEAYNRGFVPDLMTNAKYRAAITDTLNWEVSIQLNDGNMPTYSSDVQSECSKSAWPGNDSDARVQWCNGAPGFIEIYGRAAVVYDSIGDNEAAKTYMTAALKAFNATWDRGLLVKGLMQCHGIGGNTYTLLHLFKNLEIISKRTDSALNKEFDVPYLMNQSLWRAIQFIEFTLNEDNLNALRTKYSNENYSMWLGSYGINVLYIEAIQEGWPQKQSVCMIAWDFCGV